MTALVLTCVLAAQGPALADRPARVHLLAEQLRLTEGMPTLGGASGPIVQIGAGSALLGLGGALITFAFLSIRGTDAIGAQFPLGLIGGSVSIGVGLIAICVGIVRAVIKHGERAFRLERLAEIEAELARTDPPRTPPWTRSEAL